MKHALAVCIWIVGAVTLCAQNDVRGHWTGIVGEVAVEIDLDKAPTGWMGSLSMPARGMAGIPLDGVTFADGKAAFVIRGVGQRFTGTL